MPIADDWPILREGVWLYAGSVPVAVRILLSAETLGTGDDEDEDEDEDEEAIRENRQVECYFLAYEMAAAPGNFCNLMPNIMSFEDPVLAAEDRFPGIQWAPAKKE